MACRDTNALESLSPVSYHGKNATIKMSKMLLANVIKLTSQDMTNEADRFRHDLRDHTELHLPAGFAGLAP